MTRPGLDRPRAGEPIRPRHADAVRRIAGFAAGLGAAVRGQRAKARPLAAEPHMRVE